MYSYYALTAVGYKPFWKQLITKQQLVQFFVIISQSIFTTLTGEAHWQIQMSLIVSGLMVLMIVMFTNFYVRTYSRQKSD